MKKITITIFTLLSVFILVACNTAEVARREGDEVEISQIVSRSNGVNDKGETVYQRVRETHTFITNPKRVATFALGSVDIFDYVGLDKFGIEKLAVPAASLPERLSAYGKAPHINGGTLFDVDYEALRLFVPDLIILDGRTSDKYEELKEMFPYADILDASLTTYALDTHQEIVANLAKIFPKVASELETTMSEIELEINTIKQISSEYSALFILSNGFNQTKIVLSVSGADGRYGALHNDFGFKEAAPGGKISGGDAHGLPVSLENLDEINPDVIFIMDRAAVVTTVGDSSLEALKKEPIFADLEASKNNRVYALDPQSWYTIAGGFNSTKQMIDDINQFISTLSK